MITLNLAVPDPMNCIISGVRVGDRPAFFGVGKAEEGEDLRHIFGYDLLVSALKRIIKNRTPKQIADWLDEPKAWFQENPKAEGVKAKVGDRLARMKTGEFRVVRTLEGVQEALDAWLKIANSHVGNLVSGKKGPNRARGRDLSPAKNALRENYWFQICKVDQIELIKCVQKSNTAMTALDFVVNYSVMTDAKIVEVPASHHNSFNSLKKDNVQKLLAEAELNRRQNLGKYAYVFLAAPPGAKILSIVAESGGSEKTLSKTLSNAVVFIGEFVFRVNRDFSPNPQVLEESITSLSGNTGGALSRFNASYHSKKYRALQSRFIANQIDPPEFHDEELNDFNHRIAGFLYQFAKESLWLNCPVYKENGEYVGIQQVDPLNAAYGSSKYIPEENIQKVYRGQFKDALMNIRASSAEPTAMSLTKEEFDELTTPIVPKKKQTNTDAHIASAEQASAEQQISPSSPLLTGVTRRRPQSQSAASTSVGKTSDSTF